MRGNEDSCIKEHFISNEMAKFLKTQQKVFSVTTSETIITDPEKKLFRTLNDEP